MYVNPFDLVFLGMRIDLRLRLPMSGTSVKNPFIEIGLYGMPFSYVTGWFG